VELAFLPGVKVAGADVDHPPASSAKVKNRWSYASAPPLCLLAVDREEFTSSMLRLILTLFYERHLHHSSRNLTPVRVYFSVISEIYE
jgi:hypothetical protein